MQKQMTKAQIVWTPSLATAKNIDDADVVCAIEAARHRFTTSMWGLEQRFDEAASKLRASFVAEVSEHVHPAE
jgi:hypothetical protein